MKSEPTIADMVRINRQMMLSYARAILRSRAEMAEDVIEDAAYLAAQELHQYNEDEGFGPWIRSVIRFIVLQRFDQMGIRSYIQNDSVAYGIEKVFANVEALPRETWEGRSRELWKCTRKLPSATRNALKLHYLGGKNKRAIGRKMTRTSKTISKSLERARTEIAELLHNKAEEYL